MGDEATNPAPVGEDTPLLNAAQTTEVATAKEEVTEDTPLLNAAQTTETTKEEPSVSSAPEVYENFNLPEGVTLEGEVLEKVTALFKGLNLSQENAQKLVDYYSTRLQEERSTALEALARQRKEWRGQVRQRPEYVTEREYALKGMKAVITDEDEKALFTDSWLSDHPALWKVFTKIGRLVSEDSPVAGSAKKAEQNINLLRFPNA